MLFIRLLVSFAEKHKVMNTKMFEDACSVMMRSGSPDSRSMDIPDVMDNLFFEKFGMSGNDVENMLRRDFE